MYRKRQNKKQKTIRNVSRVSRGAPVFSFLLAYVFSNGIVRGVSFVLLGSAEAAILEISRQFHAGPQNVPYHLLAYTVAREARHCVPRPFSWHILRAGVTLA